MVLLQNEYVKTTFEWNKISLVIALYNSIFIWMKRVKLVAFILLYLSCLVGKLRSSGKYMDNKMKLLNTVVTNWNYWIETTGTGNYLILQIPLILVNSKSTGRIDLTIDEQRLIDVDRNLQKCTMIDWRFCSDPCFIYSTQREHAFLISVRLHNSFIDRCGGGAD